jgi:hypothetical protein
VVFVCGAAATARRPILSLLNCWSVVVSPYIEEFSATVKVQERGTRQRDAKAQISGRGAASAVSGQLQLSSLNTRQALQAETAYHLIFGRCYTHRPSPSLPKQAIPTEGRGGADNSALIRSYPTMSSSSCRDQVGRDVSSPLQSLQIARSAVQSSLPLAPTEPPCIKFMYSEGPTHLQMGEIIAPAFPPASSLTVTRLAKCVRSGRSASFVLCLSQADAAVLEVLSVLATVVASIQPATDSEVPCRGPVTPASAQLLPVSYEPSVNVERFQPEVHNGVHISIPIPPTVPDGSRVVLHRVCVSGCDVAGLDGAALQVVVGFSHDTAPAGPVWDAAQSGDVSVLRRALENGASTEEADIVSLVRRGSLRAAFGDAVGACNVSAPPRNRYFCAEWPNASHRGSSQRMPWRCHRVAGL